MLRLRPHKHAAFVARHPWVLAKSLEPTDESPGDGEVVDVVGANGRFVARGIHNGKSHIRVRLYSWDSQEPLDQAFWRRRIASALQLRTALGYDAPQGAARLIFSEADGLSGLIVDRYAGWLVVQVTALAVDARLDELVALLAELVQPRGILVRTDAKIATAEGITPRDGVVWGEPPPGPVAIEENGLTWSVDLLGGQKTGMYLDQRENRRAAAAYCGGRSVLDMCCYVGGFSLAAARLGGAREVWGIDASEKAVEQARAHAAANGITNARFDVGECFETLENLRSTGQRFGVVVLDPPRFAGSRHGVDQALRAYFRLNRLAVDLLEPDGFLVTCSCSGRVTRDDFLHMLAGVSQKSARDLQVLEPRGPAPDHPVRLSCPETDYLKCYICRVTGG
ncbi:MAG: class I SAM-dependent rRNA methyltransferase [Pirellulales bacterium]